MSNTATATPVDPAADTALATELVNKRITNMVLRHPFFSTIVLNLDTKPAPVGTACTDGTRLLYDPNFIIGLGKEQVSGLLAHEIMHVALLHPYRLVKGHHDPRLANVAMDFEINNFLDTYNKEWARKNNGEAPFPLPSGGLIDHQYDGMSWEQIYEKISKDTDKGKPQPDPEAGQWGKVDSPGAPQPGDDPSDQPGDGSSSGQSPKLKDEGDWKAIVSKAEQIAKMQGNLPGDFATLLDGTRRPEIPWHEYMRRYFDSHAAEDYDSRKSDRRYMQQDIYLPTLYSEAMGEIVVGIDNSGSIYYDKELLEKFFGELQDIVSRLRPTKTTVLQCDTRINKIDEYQPGDQINVEVKGGGGTAFEPFFDYIRENNIQPKVLVVFTDGYGSWPNAAPDYDVLAVDYGNNPDYPKWMDVIRTQPGKK